MTDPLGLVGSAQQGQGPLSVGVGGARKAGEAGGAAFKDLLMQNIEQVNKLQQDATQAIEDLSTGRRDDVESVLLATAKADTAFRLLQQVRNKVFEAYAEVQQMRV